MLFRLESALRKFSERWEMKVPETEVDLRWSLSRFLDAASKKESPSRIVIIIDGVHSLKSENSLDGILYWLPTELPPGVRFILSTVEHERNVKNSRKESSYHHTFVELDRRGCQIERIVPLYVNTSHAVINAFRALHAQRFELTETHQFKIETASSATQPMYLRSILQAMRLATTLTHLSSDELLDRFLSCVTAHELVDKALNICCQIPHGEHGLKDGSVSGSVVDENEEQMLSDLLGKMLSMVYASRSGLTEEEIWGLLRMVSRFEPTPEQKERLLIILKDFTMVVSNMYSFSHEVYNEVVYQKYINTRGNLVRWHTYLARYFDQLPPGDRKLVALPYHLEMAGSWTKVKNCLTDIEMFKLWWGDGDTKFRPDFIKFWSSLTRKVVQDIPSIAIVERNTKNGTSTANTNMTGGGMNDNASQTSHHSNHHAQPTRPSYDIVEEYCKSLDEYRAMKNPTDLMVKKIVLEIGDFLLTFAMLGHEREADVPALVHPKIPWEDLKALGVPYIIMEENHCMLMKPKFHDDEDTNNPNKTIVDSNKKEYDDDNAQGATSKALEDLEVTTYYYNRWMWIQFPFVALGNCDPKFYETGKARSDTDYYDTFTTGNNANNNASTMSMTRGDSPISPINNTTNAGSMKLGLTHSMTASTDEITKMVRKVNREMKTSQSESDLKLPAITRELDRERRLKEMRQRGHRATRTIPRIPPPPPPKVKNSKTPPSELEGSGNGKPVLTQVMIRTMALQDSIQIARQDYDQIVQDKVILERKLQTLKDSLIDLKRTAESCNMFDEGLKGASEREKESREKFKNAKIWNKNLLNLAMMCDRHPANVPALILELQEKIDLDNFLLKEIKKRLWEQRFEQQAYMASFRHMQGLVKEAVKMHDEILILRYKRRGDLARQAEEDERILSMSSRQKIQRGSHARYGHNLTSTTNEDDEAGLAGEGDAAAQRSTQGQSWEEMWSMIELATGISDPEAFFQRMKNANAIKLQIEDLKQKSEKDLEKLKAEVILSEATLQETESSTRSNGIQSTKNQQKLLADKQIELRQKKEDAEGKEALAQRAMAGLAQISDILCIPKSDEEADVKNVVHEIETILDTLMAEREKQAQQQQSGTQRDGAGASVRFCTLIYILLPLFIVIWFFIAARSSRNNTIT